MYAFMRYATSKRRRRNSDRRPAIAMARGSCVRAPRPIAAYPVWPRSSIVAKYRFRINFLEDRRSKLGSGARESRHSRSCTVTATVESVVGDDHSHFSGSMTARAGTGEKCGNRGSAHNICRRSRGYEKNPFSSAEDSSASLYPALLARPGVLNLMEFEGSAPRVYPNRRRWSR